MIGETIGNYRVVSKIGAGGMGHVYLAEHQVIGRRAALKVLKAEFSSKKSIVQRFFNEAKAAAAIKHPGIVDILEFGFHQDSAFILMGFLEGESLEDRIKRLKALPTPLALHLLRQVAGALQAAHAKEIIHRDLKPDNIFVTPDPEVAGGERIKLLDFGIAKLSGENASSVQTRTGMVMGTPAYMAPEQCKGAARVDHRADLYSLGCILCRLLCGRPPFVGEGAGDVLAQQVLAEPTAPTVLEPSISPAVETLVLRLLHKDPAMRPQSAGALIHDIDILLGTAPTPSLLGGQSASHSSGHALESPLPVRTTLSAGVVASGGQTITDAPSRRRGIRTWLAVAAALALLGGLAGVLLLQSRETVPTNIERASGPVLVADGPALAIDAGMAAGTGAEQPTQSGPAITVVTIDSKPGHATLFRDGEAMGETPYQLRLEEGQEVSLVLRLDGHRDRTIVLPRELDARGQVLIVLDPEPPASMSRVRPSGATRGAGSKAGSKKSTDKSDKNSGRLDDKGFAIIE